MLVGGGLCAFAGVTGSRLLLIGGLSCGGKCSGTGESRDGKRGAFGTVFLGPGDRL